MFGVFILIWESFAPIFLYHLLFLRDVSILNFIALKIFLTKQNALENISFTFSRSVLLFVEMPFGILNDDTSTLILPNIFLK